jgi:DNA-binding CsgD family transcriptional regulator
MAYDRSHFDVPPMAANKLHITPEIHRQLLCLGWQPPAPDANRNYPHVHPLAGYGNPWALRSSEIACVEQYGLLGTAKRVAREMGTISPATVNDHLYRARKKMGVTRSMQAVRMWQEFFRQACKEESK